MVLTDFIVLRVDHSKDDFDDLLRRRMRMFCIEVHILSIVEK